MQTRVIILSGRSLLAEGVASRLRQHPQRVNLEVMDARLPDAVSRIVSAQPSAVILESSDAEIGPLCLLSRLQLAFPGLTVIYLDRELDRIHLMTSEQLPAKQVSDLLEVIESLP